MTATRIPQRPQIQRSQQRPQIQRSRQRPLIPRNQRNPPLRRLSPRSPRSQALGIGAIKSMVVAMAGEERAGRGIGVGIPLAITVEVSSFEKKVSNSCVFYNNNNKETCE